LAFCSHLTKNEEAGFMKVLKIWDGKTTDISINEAYFNYRQYKIESSWDTSEEVNAIIAKRERRKGLKCFKCCKPGHLKHECRAKPKEENHNLIGLFGDDNSVNEEEAHMLEIDKGQIDEEEFEMETDVSTEVTREAIFASEHEKFTTKSEEFIVDTGATTHIVNNLDCFTYIRDDPTIVKTIQGNVRSYSRGEVLLPNGIILQDVV
jgi:hypothetical protein